MHGELPVLLPCHGASKRGVHAEDVAEELAARGLAEVVDDIEAVVAAARAGRVALALDGCAASCQARLLDARSVKTLRSLNLTTPDGAEELSHVETVEELEAASGPVKRVRPQAPHSDAGPDGPRRAHSLDDYLLALDALTSPVGVCGALVDAPTLAAHVAQRLGVARPTAGEMLARLEEAGYVQRGAHKEVLLTPHGRAAADDTLRRHRILECFAASTLGYSVADSYERAREVAPGFDDEAVDRLWVSLGRPSRCPHGWPTDPALARRESRDLLALAAAPADAAVVVERLEESSRERLEAIAHAGLAVGTEVSRVAVNPSAELVELVVDGSRRLIGVGLAMSVFVRPAMAAAA